MTLVADEVGEEPLVEWVTPSLTVKRGRDPLGMQTITLDRIMPRLLPGVLALSERARYLSIYPFLLSLYEERRLAADNASLGEFIRWWRPESGVNRWAGLRFMDEATRWL